MNKNSALLAKWLWRFPLEEDALWHKVISAIYGILPNGWDPGVAEDRSFRSPWRLVSVVREVFYSRVSWRVLDGSVVRFWEDVWIGDRCFKDRFPGLARLCPIKNGNVQSFALSHPKTPTLSIGISAFPRI